MTEAHSVDSVPNACPCGHAVWWHHETRGCGYHGYAPRDRCLCRLMVHEALEQVVNAAKAEALRAAADRYPGGWLTGPHPSTWLRERAARLTTPTPTGPEEDDRG